LGENLKLKFNFWAPVFFFCRKFAAVCWNKPVVKNFYFYRRMPYLLYFNHDAADCGFRFSDFISF